MKSVVAIAALALVALSPSASAEDRVIKVGALKLIHSITPYFYEKFTPAGYKIEVIPFEKRDTWTRASSFA
jgi:NitT/TauT family transport system substrate-binding protein